MKGFKYKYGQIPPKFALFSIATEQAISKAIFFLDEVIKISIA